MCFSTYSNYCFLKERVWTFRASIHGAQVQKCGQASQKILVIQWSVITQCILFRQGRKFVKDDKTFPAAWCKTAVIVMMPLRSVNGGSFNPSKMANISIFPFNLSSQMNHRRFCHLWRMFLWRSKLKKWKCAFSVLWFVSLITQIIFQDPETMSDNNRTL